MMSTNLPKSKTFRSRLFEGLSISFLIVGCGGTEADLDESQDELIGGVESYERPEVGRMEVNGASCTATLIHPRVAITAAHCVDFGSDESGTGWLYFSINRDQVQRVAVNGYKSLGTELGSSDLALLRLAEPVSPALASPATLSSRSPAVGEQVTSFGFGCTDRANTRQMPMKRKATYAYTQGKVLCPGDSGGPGFLGTNGPLALIHSAYYIQSGLDIHGEPATMRGQIDAQIAAWVPTVAVPPSNPPPSNPPAVDPNDPNACGSLGSAGGQVEEDGNCTTLGGNPRYLRSVTDGGSNGYIWTGATASPRAGNSVTWNPQFSRSSLYKVEAYIAAGTGSAKKAAYQVSHQNGSDSVIVDQSTASGYVELGYFTFASAGSIFLADNTGEAPSLSRRVVFDAIRFTPVSRVECAHIALNGTSTLNVRPLPSTERSPVTTLTGAQTAERLATVSGERSRSGDARWHRVRVGSQVGYVSAGYTRCVD